MGRIVAVLALALPLAAAAADDPETVYGKLHRATLAGNVDEVLSYATAVRRKEMASLAGKEDMVRMMAMTLPQTYSVTQKGITGRKALLQLRGVHDSSGPSRAVVELLRERGEWKVDEWSWTTMAAAGEPGLVRVQATQAAPAKAAPEPMKAAPEPMKAAPEASSTPTISSVPVEAPTLRRASAEMQPCVIKPVMTDDDLRRCGATPPKYDN